jgi:hypothetical protein
MPRRCLATAAESPAARRGVVFEEDDVAAVAGGHGGLAVGAGGKGLGGGEGLGGVPRRPLVGGAVHGGGHGQPGVEPGDGRVGAHGQGHPGLEQGPQGEAPVGPVGPALLGDVPVVSRWAGCTLARTPSGVSLS